jgi:hypothetical protein
MHKAAKTVGLAILLISAFAILAGPAAAASFRIEPQGAIEAPSEGTHLWRRLVHPAM